MIAKSYLTSLLVVLVAILPNSVKADDLVVVSEFGFWSLSEMGYETVEIYPSQQDSVSKSDLLIARYGIPEQLAQQGSDGWYQLGLHFQVDLSPSAGPGVLYLEASTSDRTVAQIRFKVHQMGRAKLVQWDTLNYQDGPAVYFTMGTSIEGSFSNFLQNEGVKPGVNDIVVGYEQFGEVEFESIRVFDDSGILYSRIGPPDLEISVEVPDDRVHIGEIVEIEVSVDNVGDLPARNVSVSMTVPNEGFRIHGKSSVFFSNITSERIARFSVEGLLPGEFDIRILASGGSGGQDRAIVRAEMQ